MYKTLTYLILATILLASCSEEKIHPKSNVSGNELENGWKVPISKLVLSHLPPDRISSIDAPHFELLANNSLKSDENVYVYRFGDTIKVYPQNVMGVHEIVNDHIGEHHFAVTFCPLTGSALAWERGNQGTGY